ncbi:MAG: hypothetical protein MUF68_07630, partial [Cyclobacteriaceae bacterium]|nr:hypothetical protein [Cyclobacteriaceae bacterium]
SLRAMFWPSTGGFLVISFIAFSFSTPVIFLRVVSVWATTNCLQKRKSIKKTAYLILSTTKNEHY